MEKLYRFRFHLLFIFLLAGIGLWPGLKKAVQVDNSLQAWFIEEDPALESYYRFQEYFGNDELIFLVFEPQGEELNWEALKRIAQLEGALEQHPDVAKVFSPLDLEIPTKNPFSVQSEKWLNLEKPRQPLTDLIDEEPFFKEQFFDAESKALKLILQLKLSPDFEARRADILQDLYKICDQYLEPEESLFGGLSVIYAAMNDLSQKDFSRFLAVGYLLMFVLIGLLYRSWAYVAYALLTILFSTYFTLGIYGSFGHRLNLLSTLIPAIIILLSVMDVMHILNERNREEGNLAQGAIDSLRRVWKPCLFTSLSTMAGFLSLGISPVKILANFGLYAALGIGFGLIFSFWLGSLILTRQKPTKKEFKSSDLLLGLQNWVLGHQKIVLSGFVLALIFSAFYIPQLKVDTDSIGYLPEDHPVRSDSRKIEFLLGPYMPLEFLVTAKDSFSLKDPEVLEGLSRLEKEAQSLAGTGRLTGYHNLFVANFKDRYGENWRTGFAKKNRIDAIAQQAEIFAPEWVRSFNSPDYKMGRFALSGELVSASQLQSIIDSMNHINAKHLGAYAKVEVSGYQSLYAQIVNYVTESQVKSLSLAVVLVFLLLWLFLKDLRLSLISIVPNFFPILIMLATMAALGIALDTATASIASIVLSFSIDDTMHFIWHYQDKRQKGLASKAARDQTISHVGRAILFTSLVLFIGYSLMIFGELKTVIYFGILTSISIVAALLSQFFLFPILLKNFDKD